MAVLIDGEEFNHGLQSEETAPPNTSLADPNSHRQNTDVGTTSEFFTIGQSAPGPASGPVRRGLVFRNGGVGPVTAFAYETRGSDGKASGRYVECRNVYNGDVQNEKNVWVEFGGVIAEGEAAAGSPGFASMRAAVLHLLSQGATGPTPPVIGGFTPASGAVGAVVLLNGGNFGATTGQVYLGETRCTVSGWNNSQITTKVPVGGVTGAFRVVTAGGQDISRESFIVVVPAAIAAPGPASGLSAQPGNGQAVLSWEAPTETGGAVITDYEVRYRLAGAAGWTVYKHTPRAVPGQTVSGLTNNEAYEFQVAAVNSKGTGQTSNVTTATPVGTAIVYRATAQSYTTTAADYGLKCGTGTTGTAVTRTSSEGVSTENQSAADLQAYAAAKKEAIEAITCTVPNTDSGVGNLAEARIAYPATERRNLSFVSDFLIYIGNRLSDISERFGLFDEQIAAINKRIDQLIATGAGSGNSGNSSGSTNGVSLTSAGDGTKFLSNDGSYRTISTSSGASLPAQSATTAGKVLKSDGATVSWQDDLTTPRAQLEFVFKIGYETTYSATIGANQAGSYAGDSKSGIGSVSYKKNGTAVALPFALVAGDELYVSIVRNTTSAPAILTLSSI